MKTYLALGDSYTIGESVAPAQRWCNQLVDLMLGKGIQIAYPDIIAKTGWTSSELLEGIAQANITKNYDLVSLLIGVNNQYRGQTLEQYKEEFEELLRISCKLAGNKNERVLVLSIPDWSVSPFAKEQDSTKTTNQIIAFNKVAEQICLVNQVAFLDILPLSRLALNNPEMIAEDELHFSEKMYALWVKEASFTAQRML